MEKPIETYNPPELVTIGDAARLLNVSTATLRNWEKAGKLSAVRLPGGHRRFRQTDIDHLIDKGQDA